VYSQGRDHAPVREYLDQLAADAAVAHARPQHKAPKYLSGTDPQSACSIKDRRGRVSYETNYMIDTDRGTGPFLAWLLKRVFAPHVPVLDRKHQADGKYDLSHFAYDDERDSFTCLDGHEMRLRSEDPATRIKRYRADTEACGACPIRKACTTAPVKSGQMACR
jgi:hypothetical protein